ncbi:MAG TPA: apolipoprotein N-acyltransferase, partial [bacterium]|nr:apolipoprotein N-acyltransferase [bacterium]
QGNLDLSTKWKPENRHAVLMDQIHLSESVIGGDPDLVMWSESSIPFIYRFAWRYRDTDNDPPGYHLAVFMETHRVPLLTGTLDMVKESLYNAAVLLRPGMPDAYYYKQKLVPFGEYIPAECVFFFVNRLVDDSIGEFSRGESTDPVVLPDGTRLSVTICYENIFPSLIRRMVRSGGDVICNLTNDAWFGDTSGPWQHFSASCFRAVETRSPVLRCANTGISGAVDSSGRILHRTEFNRETAFVATVSTDPRKTLYLAAGDWFAGGCVLAATLIYCTVFPGRSRGMDRRKRSCRKKK